MNTRPGAVGTVSFSAWPSAISPSMLVTVEFQRGKAGASVSRRQIVSELLRMVVRTAQSIRKVLARFVALELLALTGTNPRR